MKSKEKWSVTVGCSAWRSVAPPTSRFRSHALPKLLKRHTTSKMTEQTDPSSKSTADLVKRQTELAVRLGKLGREVTKCSTELEAITKELEQRVANDSELDEHATEAPV